MGCNTHKKPRGCGTRQSGGIYAECGLDPLGGAPLQDFLIDPPHPVPVELGLTAVGVKLVELGGTWHILDVIGRQHYPNVADFLEEVANQGLSRRLPRNLEYAKLGPGSRIILAHVRAIIEDPLPYQQDRWAARYARWAGHQICPRGRPDHDQSAAAAERGMCAGLWWEDVEGAEVPDPLKQGDGEGAGEVVLNPEVPYRTVVRRMPAFSYIAARRPDSLLAPAPGPRYSLGFFASFPITNLSVIRDERGGTHEAALQAASRAGLEVRLEPW